LPAGTLHVAVGAASLPPGFTAQTGDPDAVVDGAATVTLVAGGTDLTQNFGYAGQSSIGDTVWFDRDADGVRDSNDDGMGGVTVGLTWRGPDGVAGGHDDVAFTRTTDSSGHYSFDNLPAGNYAVDVGGLPPDYVNTFDEDLDLDSAAAVTLPAVQRHLTADFGYSGSAAVGDRVWWDIDGDGIQDPAEPGLAGVEVTATSAGPDAAAGDGDDIRFVRVTGADGRYSVSNTPQGQYTVAVTGGVPYGMAPTFDEDSSTSSPDQSARVTLGAAAHSTADFGYTGAGAVSGQLYLDLDGDGRYGTGDRGLPSVAVTVVWAGADAALDTADDISLSADTDASGAYAFAGLPTGDFSVTVDPADLPAGLAPMADPDAASDPGSNGQLHLASGQADAAQDFGYRGTGSVGDTVWLDLDGDGALSDGEPGLAMVDVDVTWAGVDGRFGTADDVVSATVTDGGGHYSVGNLPAGPYRVAIDSADMANGVQPTTDPDGGADNGSSLNLAAGVDRLEQDFSYRGDASVGGRVWVDVDADGVQDAGEPGYAGLAMTVVAAGRDGVFGSADDTAVSTVTQADGAFEVTGLPDGAVKVSYARRALSRGYVPGSDGDGADLTSARSTLTNGGAASSVDFGVRGTASLADVVWNDADGDGVRDPGEDGVAGVTVEAVWTGPLGRVVLHSVTAADGSWAFSALPPGSYTVSTTAAPSTAGMVSSTRHGVLSVLLPGGSASARLRQVPSASIGDLIWLDDDADGVRDATDPGIGGVAVRLVDERGATVATTDTDASGRYLFAGLTPEAYRVVIDLATLPAGQRPSGDPDGVLDAMTSLTAGPGDAAMAEDFSFAPLPSVLSIGANPLRNLTLGLATVGLAVLAFAALRRRTLAVAGQRIL
ncbi:MAG: hypothetical protein JWN99_2464, partial [Ilumatobacteraceae bacterium]|nr:hypothetical protein [Ilumatobacteraceae bacterium]